MTASKHGSKPWFFQGLRFECQRCGQCCSGPSGYVEFSQSEAQIMAEELGMSLQDFKIQYTRTELAPRFYLQEVPSNFGWDCIMLERNPKNPHQTRCRVHDSRPKQCRTWPFWSINTCERSAWSKAARRCPGFGRGELFDASTIVAISADDGLEVDYD